MDNPRIIHAPMNGRRFAVTSPITQYDYGYLLLPEGTELPTVYEVDFSNDKEKGTSLTVYGGAEGAEVPEELIRTGKDVYAFYYKVGEGYGKTEFTWRLPNKCRPSRDGETPTPSQQSSIDQLITRSNEAVESADQARDDAITARNNAQGYASNAQLSATQASNSAISANQSASASAQSASQSAQSASASAQIKSDIEGMVGDAQGYAQASAQSADRAEQAANNAGYMDVDIVNGRLVYTRTDAVDTDFSLVNGRLIMEAI